MSNFNKDQNLLKCVLCGAEFVEKLKLNKHIAIIHMLKCDYCETSFTLNQHLREHIMSVHEGHKPEVRRL